LAAEPSGNPREITAAVQEVAERAQALVREEIELARTEITEKAMSLAKGAAIGAAAGVFAIFGLSILLQGFAWLAFWALPVSSDQIFWGFFLVAVLLFVVGGVAGFLAARLFRRGAPPTPDLAIEEAQRIRETVQGD
jgi:H+/Cl- antiporter ClcA